MRQFTAFTIAAFAYLSVAGAAAEEPIPHATGIFARENLTAWCIVPFDARKRVDVAGSLTRAGTGSFRRCIRRR